MLYHIDISIVLSIVIWLMVIDGLLVLCLKMWSPDADTIPLLSPLMLPTHSQTTKAGSIQYPCLSISTMHLLFSWPMLMTVLSMNITIIHEYQCYPRIQINTPFCLLIAVLYCSIADVDNKRRTHLGVGEVMEGTLIGSISLWEFIHHQIAMPKRAPDFSTGIVDRQDPLKVLGRLLKRNEMHEIESGDRS